MRLAKLLVALIALGAAGLSGCSLQIPSGLRGVAPVPVDFSAPGRWETIRQIRYADISRDNLQGILRPIDWVYLVTMAGFQTESYGISIGPDDDVRYTTDGGQTWTKTSAALNCRHGLEIVSEKVAWHCGNGGTRVSTDGGRTWQTTAPSLCPFLSFQDARSGWAASPYALQSTVDGGNSWQSLALPAGAQDLAATSLRTMKDGYLLDVAGNLFVTADSGRSWETGSLGLAPGEQLITGSEGPKAVMRFLDDRRGLVVFDLPDGTVWSATTQDGGRTWRRVEISEIANQSLYYHLYLSRDGRLLTVTDDFNNGANTSLVLRYRQS